MVIPSPRRRRWGAGLVGGSLGLLLILGGCSKVKERQAIRRYAKGAAKANKRLRALRALDAHILVAQRSGKAAEVRRFFQKRYLPAFRGYLEAVRKVPRGTATLRRVHGRFLTVLEQTYEAHAAYAEGVTTTAIKSGWEAVRSQRETLEGALARYRKDIRAYYRKHDVRVAAN